MCSNWGLALDFETPGGSGSLSPVPTEKDLVTLGGRGGAAFSGLPEPLLRRVPKFSACVGGNFLPDLESSLDGLMTDHMWDMFCPLIAWTVKEKTLPSSSSSSEIIDDDPIGPPSPTLSHFSLWVSVLRSPQVLNPVRQVEEIESHSSTGSDGRSRKKLLQTWCRSLYFCCKWRTTVFPSQNSWRICNPIFWEM